MKKVLFIATVASHLMRFHQPYLQYFYEHGYEVHTVCKEGIRSPYCHQAFRLPFVRFPFHPSNIKAYLQLRKMIHNEQYTLIHCHTPVGGVLGRLAARKSRKKGTKVIYTAHGFHFYKGAPLHYWLLYYPVEKLLAPITDALITINPEDYNFARKRLPAPKVVYVPGVGIDTDYFQNNYTAEEILAFRKEEGLSGDDFVLLCVADLRIQKHQDFFIRLAPKLQTTMPNVKFLFVGDDHADGRFQALSRQINATNVFFLGERKDVRPLLALSQAVVSASEREGLAVALLEAMAMDKCIVASSVRGQRELIQHGKNGFLFPLGNEGAFMEILTKLYTKEWDGDAIGRENHSLVKLYSLSFIKEKIIGLYKELSI